MSDIKPRFKIKKATDQQLSRYSDLVQSGEGHDNKQLQRLGSQYVWDRGQDTQNPDVTSRIKAIKDIRRRSAMSSRILNSKKRIDGTDK